MDTIDDSEVRHDHIKGTRDQDRFGAVDVAVVADALGVDDVPVVGVLGAVLLLPFIIVAFVKLIWPVARWFASWLDYRRYLNSGTW